MSKEKIIESAEKFAKAAKWDKAIKEYQKILAEDVSDMRAKLKIADLYARKKDVPSALKIYREVAEHYDKEDFHLKAIAVYKTILKCVPTLIEINERLGNLYHRVGLTQDAINQYYIVATYYEGKGLMKEATAIRRKIVDMDPSHATGRIRLAELLQAGGQAEESLREYERASEILAASKEREGLSEVYEKMIYFQPQNALLLATLCKLYLEKKDPKRALRRIEAAPAKVKKALPVMEFWAEALLADHQMDQSRRKFKELYSLALESRSIETASKVYSRVLKEFSDDPDYLNELEEARKKAGVTLDQVKPGHREDFERTDKFKI